MSWSVEVRNYRGLSDVRWAPQQGVSCVVGPNGTGKTTLLFVPNLMARAAGERGPGAALDEYGGPQFMRHFKAGENESVILRFQGGPNLSWTLEPSTTGALWGEELLDGKSRYVRRLGQKPVSLNGSDYAADERSILYNIRAKSLGSETPHDGATLLSALNAYRVYHDYRLLSLRVNGSRASETRYLDRNGNNVLSVLRNWRDLPSARDRYDFVLEGLRECFPQFDDLGFEGSQNIAGRLVERGGPPDGVPLQHAPNGLLVAMLHLTAVASAGDGGIVAIDEIEQSLHPAALHTVLDLMDEYAQERGLTVVVTTHAPMVLDWFEATPERVWVMEPSDQGQLIELSELRNRAWLSHFRLGQLYVNHEFGAPKSVKSS